jgi:hypothetical protein
MSKDKDDNRDIFEKALDYAPTVAGAVIGGGVARKLSKARVRWTPDGPRPATSKYQKMARGNAKARRDYVSRDPYKESKSAKDDILETARGWDRTANQIGAIRVAKFATVPAGAGAGYAAGEEIKKRRK